ncbi:NUDIX hydrolase [Acetobacter syzygii]|uniref:NUDIX hydrolase n=1 Tax=Acetobacter syzygii TaxID=146476 RepID=UPI0039E9AFE6
MTCMHGTLDCTAMNAHPPSVFPRAGVLAIVRRGSNFLLVRRANPPDAGLWGFPGGKVEGGETFFQAAERELMEETSIQAKATSLVDVFDSIHYAPDGTLTFHYLILAVLCTEPPPALTAPVAGDDAQEARWFSYEEISQLGEQASARLYSIAHTIMQGTGTE